MQAKNKPEIPGNEKERREPLNNKRRNSDSQRKKKQYNGLKIPGQISKKIPRRPGLNERHPVPTTIQEGGREREEETTTMMDRK